MVGNTSGNKEGAMMTWFDILKENRLVSENITHTKVGENKPEVDDSRCRDRLQQFFNDLDALVKSEPDWHLETHEGGLTLTEEAFPEQICCEILERLASSRSDTQGDVGFHYRKKPVGDTLDDYGFGREIHMWMFNDNYRDDIDMDWSRCGLFYSGFLTSSLGGPDVFLVELEQLVDGKKITEKDWGPQSKRKQRYENWIKFRKKLMGILP